MYSLNVRAILAVVWWFGENFEGGAVVGTNVPSGCSSASNGVHRVVGVQVVGRTGEWFLDVLLCCENCQ